VRTILNLNTMVGMTAAGAAVSGLLLIGTSLLGDDEAVTKREDFSLENDEGDGGAPDDVTDDKTLDTNARNSVASRDGAGAMGASQARDNSVDAAPTSGVTRGTVSGGAGTVDVSPTSGVSRTASGGAGTVDGGGGGGGDVSRDSSRGSGATHSRG